jgi:hypothetical protein
VGGPGEGAKPDAPASTISELSPHLNNPCFDRAGHEKIAIQVGRNWSRMIVAGSVIGILLVLILVYVFTK